VSEYERGREDGAAEYAASMDAERAGWARRIAELEAEACALREALYPLVVGCLEADAREDAPEFVNGEHERGRDALPRCERCAGTGATDHEEYVDRPIPAVVLCHDCGGWGFTKHHLTGSTALRDFVRPLLVDAAAAGLTENDNEWRVRPTPEAGAIADRVLKEAGL